MNRGRPDPKLIERLREGKRQLRAKRASLSIEDKIEILVELQKIACEQIELRRPLKRHERPWDRDESAPSHDGGAPRRAPVHPLGAV